MGQSKGMGKAAGLSAAFGVVPGFHKQIGEFLGNPAGGGYEQLDVLSPEQKTLLNQILGNSSDQFGQLGSLSQNPLYQQASQAVQGFLPGGQGFSPIQSEANRNFQQNTIPSIMNAFGSNAKSSSALNQALAASASNLNSSLASQLAQMQLGAANQASNLAQQPYNQALSQAGLGLGTQPFALTPQRPPLWQELLLSGIQAGGKVGSAAMGGF